MSHREEGTGAGCFLSRADAKELIDLDEYRESMKGIYSTSVRTGTIDESPMAYKDPKEILRLINFERNMKKKTINYLDAIKAMRRGNREAEQELFGPGFHSHNKIHKSEKIYTRKKKHKGGC